MVPHSVANKFHQLAVATWLAPIVASWWPVGDYKWHNCIWQWIPEEQKCSDSLPLFLSLSDLWSCWCSSDLPNNLYAIVFVLCSRWQAAGGRWQLEVGSWQLASAKCHRIHEQLKGHALQECQTSHRHILRLIWILICFCLHVCVSVWVCWFVLIWQIAEILDSHSKQRRQSEADSTPTGAGAGAEAGAAIHVLCAPVQWVNVAGTHPFSCSAANCISLSPPSPFPSSFPSFSHTAITCCPLLSVEKGWQIFLNESRGSHTKNFPVRLSLSLPLLSPASRLRSISHIFNPFSPFSRGVFHSNPSAKAF